MPYFMIHCIDRPDAGDLRVKTRPPHLEYLQSLGPRLFAAGALIEDDRPIGSLILGEFDDIEQARAFAAGDPFAKAGLFDTVKVTTWRKALPAD